MSVSGLRVLGLSFSFGLWLFYYSRLGSSSLEYSRYSRSAMWIVQYEYPYEYCID